MRAGICGPGVFRDWQRIKIRPEPDGRPRLFPLDDHNNPGPGNSVMNLIERKVAETFGNEGNGFGAIEPKFRNRMEMAAPAIISAA